MRRPGSLLAIVAVSLAAPLIAHAAERPNIILIYLDDHAYQAISAYGSRINTTPNIDRLATGGLRFDRCYVTNSICAPARAVVQTGRYAHGNGVYVNGNTFDAEQPTMPKMLQAAGYETALIGKWHLRSLPTGYDHYEILVGQGTYYNPRMIRNGERVRHGGYTTDVVTDLTLKWLREQRDPQRPFMLMYQHKSPHRPFDPPLRYLKKYDDTTIPEPPTLFEDYSRRGVAVRQQDMTISETLDDRDLKFTFPRELDDEQRAAWEAAYGPKNLMFKQAQLRGDALTRWKYQRYIKDYLRCVDAIDDNVGRLLDYLDEAGLADNTVVIYTSDQGFFLGEHGWFDKRFMYEETLKTPLIVRWPGVAAANSSCELIVSNVDLAPTLLDIAGVEPSAPMHGVSMAPLLRGERPEDWRDYFYYHYYEYPAWHHVRKHYGVADGRYKLIHFYESDVDEWELYDREFDPFELSNLYSNPTYAPVRERLTAALDRLREDLDVPAEDPPDSLRTFPPRTRIQTDR